MEENANILLITLLLSSFPNVCGENHSRRLAQPVALVCGRLYVLKKEYSVYKLMHDIIVIRFSPEIIKCLARAR